MTSVRFAKAAPQQARLKVSVYGPPGSGKTFTTLLFAEGLAKVRGKRVAFVDTERGTDFYSMKVPSRAIHPEAFDFDAIYTRSLADIKSAVESLDTKTHGVIVIDSFSHVWDAAQDAYEGKRTKGDGIPFGGWAQLKRPYKALLAWLIASPFDVFILGRQKAVYEDVDDQPKKVGVAMRAEADTPYEPHVCMRMEARKDPADPTKSIYEIYVEKDRTGVLAGKVIRNPTFTTIEPLLPLLGETQAPAEDEEERVAKDGELLTEADDKSAKKAEKSRAILLDYQGQIHVAATMEDLGRIAADLKKQRRYLVDEHYQSLLQTFNARRAKVADAIAPEVA